jgi:hypothetical protein
VVGHLLDDPVFFAPYRRHFYPIFGRPSIVTPGHNHPVTFPRTLSSVQHLSCHG